MHLHEFMLQRHQDLHDKFLTSIRAKIKESDFRRSPIAGTQPIVWLIWHMARVEDMGLSRFIWKKDQLYNQDWKEKINSDLSHYGTSMTEAEVADFATSVNVYSTLDYFQVVGNRTKEELAKLDVSTLNEVITEEEVKRIVTDEGMASSNAQWVIPHYVGKTRGWMLCHMGLTHNFRHFGQIVLVKKLLGYS